jgi:hypothetical protein
VARTERRARKRTYDHKGRTEPAFCVSSSTSAYVPIWRDHSASVMWFGARYLARPSGALMACST